MSRSLMESFSVNFLGLNPIDLWKNLKKIHLQQKNQRLNENDFETYVKIVISLSENCSCGYVDPMV